MSRARRGVALVAVVLVATLIGVSCTAKRGVTGWAPSFSEDAAYESFAAHANLFSEVSPFSYVARSATDLASEVSSSRMDELVATARKAGVPVLPTIADGTAARAMAAILADPAQRAAHVKAIVDLVRRERYDGIDLDYEKFAFSDGSATWTATRPAWVQFVAELGAALHSWAKLLSVTVPPTYDDAKGPGSGYWVYDYAGIAPHADRVRIMAYDYSWSSPGPIAPLGWTETVVAYAVTKIPRAKIQLGVPAYGRNWVVQVVGTCPAGVDLARFDLRATKAAALAAAKGVRPVRDQASAELTFTYVDAFTGPPPPPPPPPPVPSPTSAPPTTQPPNVGCWVKRTMWYADAEAVVAKARLASHFGISGIAQWAVGFEDPAQWPALESWATGRPHPAGVDPLGAVDRITARSRAIDVAGWAFDPESDLPTRVRITVGSAVYEVLARSERPDVARTYPGAGPFHGFGLPLPASPGVQRVCVDALGLGAGAATTRIGCQQVTVPA